MSQELDHPKTRREYLRWLLLLCLNAARPHGCSEMLVLVSVRGALADVRPDEIRAQLDYLDKRQLAKIDRSELRPHWIAELTREGIDVVEYSMDCEAGIARPRKYF